jgi:nucleotide-binding universal stress UspA family protein
MFKNILLGVDGSPNSMHAAKASGELARSLKADLRIVIVFEPIPTYLGEPLLQQAISSRMETAEHVLHEALNVIGEIPGQLKTEVLEGPTAEAILAAASIHNNDLIIMGSRGLGKLAGLLLGSQSQKVVQHASCPVLIVR